MKIVDGKLITCILPDGAAHGLMERLREERGIESSMSHHARGMGFSGSRRRRGIAEQIEKDILLVAVSSEQADEVFEFIYYAGGLDRPHAGFMFMERLRFVPPPRIMHDD